VRGRGTCARCGRCGALPPSLLCCLAVANCSTGVWQVGKAQGNVECQLSHMLHVRCSHMMEGG